MLGAALRKGAARTSLRAMRLLLVQVWLQWSCVNPQQSPPSDVKLANTDGVSERKVCCTAENPCIMGDGTCTSPNQCVGDDTKCLSGSCPDFSKYNFGINDKFCRERQWVVPTCSNQHKGHRRRSPETLQGHQERCSKDCKTYASESSELRNEGGRARPFSVFTMKRSDANF